MAKIIVAELQDTQPRRQAEFIIEPNMIVDGDTRLLSIALNNLLSNSWKFTSKLEHTRIEFGCVEIDKNTTYFVCDNGAGFDMAYINKLFAPFQRLHTVTEFEGNGIGLATVQRIIRKHGGRVWAKGEIGKGATFYFTLTDQTETV